MAYVDRRNNIYYIRYKDSAGKWKRKSCGKNMTKREAEYLAKQYSAKELNYYHKAPIRVLNESIFDALNEFRDKVLGREHKSINSIQREQTVLDNFRAYLNNAQVKRFDEVNANEYFDARKASGAAPKTLKEEKRVLSKFYRFAISSHYTEINPVAEVVTPKLVQKHPRFFSKEELDQIYAASKEPYKSIFQFMANTGLRSGEIANLQWNDWNRELNKLTIRIVEGDRKERRAGNKTKREGMIPLNTKAVDILKALEAEKRHPQYIFTNGIGNQIDNDNIYRVFKPILRKLSINDGTVHTFRHTFASHLAIKGISLYVIKELLRHKSIKETEIYAHLSNEATAKAVSMLNL